MSEISMIWLVVGWCAGTITAWIAMQIIMTNQYIVMGDDEEE